MGPREQLNEADAGDALTSGTRLGPYEVQRTRRGRHGRGLSRARHEARPRASRSRSSARRFAADPDRVARFEREAKVLASLNHPHIAALYGMEEADGRHFLVMELVEGETLAERLRRGPMPVEEALTIALQIADALEAAHEKGIVHRDLKPANVKITPDEQGEGARLRPRQGDGDRVAPPAACRTRRR